MTSWPGSSFVLSDGRVHALEPDTDSDEYAFVLSTEPLDKASARQAYMSRWEDDE